MHDTPTQIAIAIVEREESFLVGERAPGQTLAGQAEFPGGRVEENETAEQAAVRECFEETGLVVKVVSRHGEQLHDYEHDRVHLHFFQCVPTADCEDPKPPFRWVARTDLETLRFPDANEIVVQRLVENKDIDKVS